MFPSKKCYVLFPIYFKYTMHFTVILPIILYAITLVKHYVDICSFTLCSIIICISPDFLDYHELAGTSGSTRFLVAQ